MNKNYAVLLLTMVLMLNVNVPISCLSTTSAQTANGGGSIKINHRLITTESELWIMGEVINNKNIPIKDLQVRITFYNHSHDVMTETSAKSWLEVILPNRKSVFMARFEKLDVEGFATYEITVESYKTYQNKPLGLVITKAVVYMMPEKVIIEGKILNNGSETTNFILIIALYYDAQGFFEATSDQIVDPNGVPSHGERNFKIYSKFANSSNLERCVVTAESFGLANYTGYAVQEEITRIREPQNKPNDYSVIIGSIVIITLIIAVVFAVWKKKQKSRRVKRLRKMHLIKTKRCTIEMT